MSNPSIWREAVGPVLDAVTAVEDFRDGTLWVAAASPEWAAELEAMTPRILAKLKHRHEVKAIRWVGLAPRRVE